MPKKKPLLTDTQAKRILAAAARGDSHPQRAAGLNSTQLYAVFQAAQNGDKRLKEFWDAYSAAKREAAGVKSYGSVLRRKKERDAVGDDGLARMVCAEAIKMVKDGRVPPGVAAAGLEMAMDELRSAIIDGSVSWAEHPERAQVPSGKLITEAQ